MLLSKLRQGSLYKYLSRLVQVDHESFDPAADWPEKDAFGSSNFKPGMSRLAQKIDVFFI